MDIKVIEERLSNSKESLVKVENLLSKLERFLGLEEAKSIKPLKDIKGYSERKKMFDKLVGDRDYDYYYKAEQYLSNLYKQEDLLALILKYENMLKIKDEEKAIPEVEVIREFLNKWKEKSKSWYLGRLEDYHKEKESISRTEYRDFINRWVELVGKTIYSEMSHRSKSGFTNWITNEIEKEAVRKYVSLVNKIFDITGNITNTAYLSIDPKGEINGLVEGEKGVASINTFSAGGYNIQCFHYRTQIRKIK